VATVNNAPVTSQMSPRVSGGVEPEYTMVTADGHPTALVNINRQPDANTVAVVDEVRRRSPRFAARFRKTFSVAAYYDQSLLVRGLESILCATRF
jgi:multidrug efflux pump subunit AcrB